VAVDVAAEAVAELGLVPGLPVRLRVDPADVRFVSAADGAS
jgi:molybdate transport system ATP-binding protein